MKAQKKKKEYGDNSHSTYRYGTIELEQGMSDEEDNDMEDEFDLDHTHSQSSALFPANKRWSVLEKLDKQYTRRDGSCVSCIRSITSRCVLATLMLVAFVVFAWYFTRTLLFNIQINPDIYDFIVVGGGPAGSVVARRLLDEGATVLVLESGGNIPYVTEDNSDSTALGYSSTISEFDIPLLWSSVAENPDVHYGPFDALNVRAFEGLGGGGMHSALLYVRAVSADILSWNVPTFDWDSMLSAYVQLERYQYTSRSLEPDIGAQLETEVTAGDDPALYRGTQGYFPTHAPGCTDSLGKSFLSAALRQGERFVRGFNGPEARAGAGCYEVSVEQGVRVSPVKALLHDHIVSNRKQRLTLRTGASVQRVLLDKEQGAGLSIGIISQRKRDKHNPRAAPAVFRAVGVEYTLNGESKYAYLSTGPSRQKGAFARDFESLRCVVLAAGALHTPKLLMNSGVGPAEQLHAAGVEVKVDSPNVGKHLQDHIAVGLTFEAKDAIGSDYGNAYAFPQQWSSYTRAVDRALSRSSLASSGGGVAGSRGGSGRYRQGRVDSVLGTAETDNPGTSSTPQSEDFGLLGGNGISAGAFLVSPFAANSTVADMQVTVYPAVTEPHFLSLTEFKRREGGKKQGRGGHTTSNDFRNQMLITIALLAPDAHFQVTLNATHPWDGLPSISAESRDSSGSGGGGRDNGRDSSRTISPLAKRHKKKFDPTDVFDPIRRGMNTTSEVRNIVPQALSERDTQRLAWAVARVREIVSGMTLQGHAVVEVIPGPGFGEVDGNASLPVGVASVRADSQSGAALTSWVRDNAFFQSNWVGSAALGRSRGSATTPAGTGADTGAGGRTSINLPSADDDNDNDDAEPFPPSPADAAGDSSGGEKGDPGLDREGTSVLDEQLNVRNVLSLRIADASVIPRLPSGNIQATVLAVAWRAADFILKTFD